MTGVTIDLSSAAGDGGNLLAVANGGTTNVGSVILSNIDASGSLNGGNVTVIAEGNITMSDINTSASKIAGSIQLTSAAIQVIGTPQVLNGVLSKGSFAAGTTANGNITAGILNAGSADINIETNGGTISTKGALTANDLRLAAGTGTIDLGAINNLTAQTDATGNGGLITLISNNIVFNSTSAVPLVLNADGTGNGNGGNIIYRTGSATPTFVGVPVKTAKPPANFLSLSAQGGTTDGDGGSIEVEAGGNLFVDPAAAKAGIRAAAGSQNGAFYTFTAGTTGAKGGTLVISGNLVADGSGGGAGGQINLQSANKKAFVLGSAKLPKNGVFGTLSADPDGSIFVRNLLGGVTVSSNSAVSGGLVDLTAAAKGKIAAGKGVTISAANQVSLTSDLGAIGGKKALLVNAPTLVLNSNTTVGVQNDFVGNKTLGNSSAGKGFTLTALGAGDLTLNNIVATGTVTVTGGTGGALNVNGDLTAQDGGINLQNPDVNVGSINIASVDIHTAGQKGRDVVITIGAPPKDPTNTTAPANFAPPDLQDGGVVYFGPVGGVVGSPTVFTHAIGKDVIFNNASPTLTNTINIAGGADIEADPPVKLSQPRNSLLEAQAFGSMLNVAMPVPLTQAVQSTNGSLTQDLFNSQTVSSASGAIDLIAMQSGSLMALPASGTARGADAACGARAQLSEDEQQALFDSMYTVDAFVWSDEDFGLPGGSVLPADVRESNTDAATLRTGHVLFAPQKDTSVSTPFGTVEIAADSMVLVIANKNGLGIYDLHDSKKGAVRIKTGCNEFALSPGRCTHITSASTKQFHDINPLEAVGYRGLSETVLQSGLKLFSSEFSTVHAVSAVRPLKQLVSANNAKARKLSNQMMKTSAVLMHLNAAGEYNFYQKPQVAAYNVH